MKGISLVRYTRVARYGILIGLAGGIAEIVWITLFGALASTDAAVVAGAVSATVSPVLPGTSLENAPVAYGIIIHMLFAAGLGIALVFAWHALTGHVLRRINEYVFMGIALITVWAFNFFVLLPVINPEFVDLVPYSASLASKLLFGLAGAVVLRHATVGGSALISVRVHIR